MTVLPIETSSTLFWTTNDLKSLYEIRLGRRYALSTCWTSRTAHKPRMRDPNESLSFFFSPSIIAKLRRKFAAGHGVALLPPSSAASRRRNRCRKDSTAAGTNRGTQREGPSEGAHAVRQVDGGSGSGWPVRAIAQRHDHPRTLRVAPPAGRGRYGPGVQGARAGTGRLSPGRRGQTHPSRVRPRLGLHPH